MGVFTSAAVPLLLAQFPDTPSRRDALSLSLPRQLLSINN